MKKYIFIAVVWYVPIFMGAQNPHLNAYQFGEGLNFSGDKGYSMELTGYVQPYFESLNYTKADSNKTFQRFRMRRLRLRLAGEAARQKIDYRLQVDLSGSSEVGDGTNNYLLMDAWIEYNITKRISVTFGQRTTPTDNRELTLGSQTLQLVERSRLTSVFSSIREFGIFADGTFRTGGGTYLRPHLAITNGDGLNMFAPDHGGLKVGGRLDFLPFGLFTHYGQFREADVVRERSPKFVIGVCYSYNSGMSSRRGRDGGSIIYLNDSSEESLPDYVKYGVDFMFKYRGFSALGEFMGSSATVPDDITQRVRNDGSTSRSFDVDGVQDVEDYIKGRMMLGKGYNIQMGYIFKNRISVDARYTHLTADKYSFFNNGTFYNRPNYYTIGLSKYLSKDYGFKIQGSLTYVDVAPGSNDIHGYAVAGNEWVFRLITSIAF